MTAQPMRHPTKPQKSWVKWWREWARGPEWQELSDMDKAVFVECLCYCDSDSGKLPDLARLAFDTRRDGEQIAKSVDVLTKGQWLELTDDGCGIAAWDCWQDSSAEKSRRYRSRKRDRSATVAPLSHHRSATPLETEAETEAEAEAEAEADTTAAPYGYASPVGPPTTDTCPPCPHQEIVCAYHETLPELPQVRTWPEHRRALLRARWREDECRQTVEAWRLFFAYVRRSDFLMGQGPCRDGGAPFIADLEWLIRPGNFAKVIDGKYHRNNSKNIRLLGEKAARTADAFARVIATMEEED